MFMKIKHFLLMILSIIIFVFIALVFVSVFAYFSDNKQISGEAKFAPVCFGKNCFNAEIASSFPVLMRGLMFRKALEENGGMLFVFLDENKHSFWMKNTLIPLDIIWLSGGKEAVYIAKNVQPCETLYCPSISPDKAAKYVLEVNGGKADEIGVKIGDKADFELR